MKHKQNQGRARESRGSRKSYGLESGAGAGAFGHRRERLQHLIQEELVSLLRDEISDPRLAPVRVSSVLLSEDGASARVAYVLLVCPGESEDPPQVAAALERATGFFHVRLAEALDLKRLPRLRFVLLGVTPVESDSDDSEGPWST